MTHARKKVEVFDFSCYHKIANFYTFLDAKLIHPKTKHQNQTPELHAEKFS
jgi:hypothetical protein